MNCTHLDLPNVLSLPSAGNPHCCNECFSLKPVNGKPEWWALDDAYDDRYASDTKDPWKEREWGWK
jgi:hypothetical protein